MEQKTKRPLISSPLLRAIIFSPRHLKRIFILLAIVLFVVSCSHSPKQESLFDITAEEREWMEPFFKELLLEETAIYTLWGSKPVTRCVLYYHTDNELEELYNQMTEQEKKEVFFRENSHFEENWEKWEKIQSRFPMKRYLLFKVDNPGSEKTALVYFVNILETALTMRQHYAMFKNVICEDFDPFEMACDFKNINSSFWKKIHENVALTGILFGFGARNSWSFQWKYFPENAEYEHLAEAIFLNTSDTPRHGKSSLINFSIPIFKVVDDGLDKMVEKYQREREKIKKTYEGQDFVRVTLEQMISS